MIHAIYGGVYGKKHDSIYAHPMTGDVMPVLNHQGAAAPCGLIAGSDFLFGGGFDQHLFACYFNLHKVVNHKLIPDGPTYTTEDADLLFCDHPDFHPTDVFEDADGSLLIVDTGGWYKVCCPTSQLAKPDVLGAIYRVRKKGAPKVSDPLGTSIPWASLDEARLTELLADNRLFVHRRATAELRKRGAAAEKVLQRLSKATSLPRFDSVLCGLWQEWRKSHRMHSKPPCQMLTSRFSKRPHMPWDCIEITRRFQTCSISQQVPNRRQLEQPSKRSDA